MTGSSGAGQVEAPRWGLRQVLERLDLDRNETKTRVGDAREERLDCLGFAVHIRRRRQSGKRYPPVEPARRSVQRITARLQPLTDRRRRPVPMPQGMAEVNRTRRG